MNKNVFYNRHPVLIYFVLAFLISWGLLLLLGGTGRFFGLQTPGHLKIPMLLVMLAGPFFSSLIMITLTDGKAGLRDLGDRLLRWRVRVRWYAVLLINPLLTILVLLGFSALVSPVYLPTFLPFGILGGFLAGFFEEVGWTGFATPRLLKNYRPLAAGLIIGMPWGFWHLLSGFLGNAPGQEGLWLAEALIFWVGGLTAYRMIMTWVYDHTHSLLIGQLMHMAFTGAFVAFIPVMSVQQYFAFYVMLTLVLWMVVGVIAWSTRRATVTQATAAN